MSVITTRYRKSTTGQNNTRNQDHEGNSSLDEMRAYRQL
jgi:hypothetical protein